VPAAVIAQHAEIAERRPDLVLACPQNSGRYGAANRDESVGYERADLGLAEHAARVPRRQRHSQRIKPGPGGPHLPRVPVG